MKLVALFEMPRDSRDDRRTRSSRAAEKLPVKLGDRFKAQCSFNTGGPAGLSLPKAVADFLGIKKGQWITFVVEKDGIRSELVPAARTDFVDDEPTDPDVFGE